MRRNPVLAELGSYAIADIQQKARAMRAAGEPLIDFSIGDPREPTPLFIREAMRAAIPEVSQYPTVAGLPQLREAIAAYFYRRFDVVVDPDTQVLPTRGSKEAVFSTPLAFVDRQAGDGVIWPTPGYPVYERGARLAGAIGDPVALSGDFVFTVDMVPDTAWERAAMLWISSPHNPSGSVMSNDQIAAFLGKARSAGAILCSDECYVDLYEKGPPGSVLQVAGPGAKGALAFMSLSKRSGMTGYRSGAVVGDAEAITLLKSLRTGTGTAPTEHTQIASAAAWNDDAHVAERRAIFTAKRAIIEKAFADLGFGMVGSEAGLYAWIEVGDDVMITEKLLECGVVVSPGRAFGSGGEGYIRLALVPTVEQCESAVEVVKACLQRN